MKVSAYSMATRIVTVYDAPSIRDIEKNFNETFGSHMDRMDRQRYEGGLPLLWRRANDVLEK